MSDSSKTVVVPAPPKHKKPAYLQYVFGGTAG